MLQEVLNPVHVMAVPRQQGLAAAANDPQSWGQWLSSVNTMLTPIDIDMLRLTQ